MKEPWELQWRDYYHDLGIEADAGEDGVHAAFRALARLHHPDVQQGKTPVETRNAERRFKIIVEAYDVLRDRARRAAYDDARARSVDGATPLPEVAVEPAAVRVFSWNGDIVVRSHVTLPKGAAQALLSIDCDDPHTELLSVDLSACRHGRFGVSDAVVRARLSVARPRPLQIEYAAGAARAAQEVRARVLPPPLLWLGRIHARRGWLALFGMTGFITLFAAPLTLSLNETAGGLVILAALLQIGLGLLSLLLRMVATPGWWRQFRPRGGRWAYVVLAIVGLNVVRLVFRAFG